MLRLIAVVLAAATCTSAVLAQSAPVISTNPPELTLVQALERAGVAAPELDAASADIRAATAGRAVAGLRPNPALSVEAENVVGSGLYKGVDSVEATTSLALPIELGGKRSARIAVANAQVDRASIVAAMAAADLRQSVTEAYVEALASERRLITAREQARLAAEVARAATVRVKAGRASPIEEQRAGVGNLNAQAALARAERQAEVARFLLVQRLGSPIEGPLDAAWFDRVETRHGPLRPIDGEGTLSLAAARADLSTADARVRLARSLRVPDLTLSTGARRLEATNDTAAVFSLSIPLPVFNNGRAALNQATAERDRAEAQRRLTARDVSRSIALAQADVANAAMSAATAKGPALAAAEEAARIARIGYREGKFGQLELIDAERTLSETRTAAIDALAAYHIAQARLERLTTPVPADKGN